MRETKFRGKDRLGNWEEGDLVQHPLGKTFIIQYRHTAPMWIDVDPETVCQYTGKTDRMGVEIFDGDIMDCDYFTEPCEVIWESDGWLAETEHGDSCMLATAVSYGCTVTGSRFDKQNNR